MSSNGMGPIQDATRGLKLFQPEMSALMQRAGMAERSLEEKEKQLALDRLKFEEEVKQFHEMVGAEKQKLREAVDKHDHEMKWERQSFSKEKEVFEEAQSCGVEMAAAQEPVSVEVGGDKFRTGLHTLARCQGSVFPKLVEPLYNRDDTRSKRDPYIFIDRDGKHFRFILNYLRQGDKVMGWSAMRNPDISTLNEILDEVKYYKIAGLEKLLRRKMSSLKDRITFETFVKAKYFQRDALGKYKTTMAMEIKDGNLTDITFSKVEFCHPVTFENCTMRLAKFTECQFKSAFVFANVDLYRATFVNCEGLNPLEAFVFRDTDKSGIQIVPLPGRP